MQLRKSRLLFLALLLGSLLSWYVGGAFGVEYRLASLANQPHVNTAFADPISGKSDALMALIAFSLLAPLAAFLLVIVVLFVVRGIESILLSIRLPSWLSVPLVTTSIVVAVYSTSQSWLPPSLYALGLVARAYFVYSYGAY